MSKSECYQNDLVGTASNGWGEKLCFGASKSDLATDSLASVHKYKVFTKILITALITAMKMVYDMQEFQKATCSSCGTILVAESATVKLCPSCASKQEHHQHSGCGCGH